MEPLIRGASALAARLAGKLLAAAVTPAAASAGPDPVLAGYTALVAQLGGTLATLSGTPAAALTAFAAEHHVTELLLARGRPARGGHHPVLRELARRSSYAEVHVLPAGAQAERQTQDRAGDG
jgi:K+-sensing histidine kinase KdpD